MLIKPKIIGALFNFDSGINVSDSICQWNCPKQFDSNENRCNEISRLNKHSIGYDANKGHHPIKIDSFKPSIVGLLGSDGTRTTRYDGTYVYKSIHCAIRFKRMFASKPNHLIYKTVIVV